MAGKRNRKQRKQTENDTIKNHNYINSYIKYKWLKNTN